MEEQLEIQNIHPPSLSRSAKHYHADGDLFVGILTDNVLFCVSTHRFTSGQTTQGMQQLRSTLLAAGPGVGETPATPVILFNVRAKEFDVLCDFLYAEYNFVSASQNVFEVDCLADLLRMGVLFAIPDAISWAVERLDSHPGLTHARRLSLSQKYGITSWFYPSFRSLVVQPLTRLSAEDTIYAGPKVMNTLIRIHDNIITLRHSMVLYPPLGLSRCEANNQCIYTWTALWRTYATSPLLFTPPGKISTRDLLNNFQNDPVYCRICRVCYVSNTAAVRELLAQEGRLISSALDDHYDRLEFWRIRGHLEAIGYIGYS
ncbi:hypothetical protein NM688_g6375 [Phlebia brevispora]|uniref:Uncharacterized protein n=1 Tax=Phlebia brevispora TaxID=194682 RepID=A0ACC1SGN7_9APHY|nr:hypothetical protein NM688_g6375 [Phlebia brevispora]